uniref:DNA mismatch repair protein n=1 Tax=Psilocybe cubensis TaxID=181762 RepID=A0A8H7XWG4_PSICU
MAPKPSTEQLKQKSLTSFFAKGPAASTTPAGSTSKSSSKPVAKPKTEAVKAKEPVQERKSSSSNNALKSLPPSSPHEPKTPETRHTGFSTSGRSSVPSTRNGTSPPPSSDPIDVDMLDNTDDAKSMPSSTKSTTQSRSKRKVILDDSDEEAEDAPLASNGRRKASIRSSSPTEAIRSQTKRPRLSTVVIEDDEEEDEEDLKASLSQRLSRFKKSPVKKGNSKSRASSDDEDFIVPDDSDEDSHSIKSHKSSSSRRSSTSSRTSAASSEDEDHFDDDDLEEDEAPKKSKAKTKTKSSGKSTSSKSSAAKPSGDGVGNGTFSLLTAAEQREQEKKDDKKAAESPYDFLMDVRDKDGKRPGEEGYDPRTLLVPKKAWATFTPFEKQFWEIKQNHYDTILFFQKGKFFELYEDDARIGHQVFDLKLTNRVKMCMVGVPEMSFNMWASKFLAKGYKVGRVEQAETALGAEMRMAAEKSSGKTKAKGSSGQDKIVRRELNKVYTSGTLVDQEFLTDDQAGHCICVCEATTQGDEANDDVEPESERKFGVCVLDCSTSEFNLSYFEDDVCRTRMETLMRQICPKEILYKKGTLSKHTLSLLKSVLPAGCLWTSLRPVEGFKYEETLEELKKIYPTETGEDVEMDQDDPSYSILPDSVPAPIREMARETLAIEALGSMIWYLRQLNIDKDILSMKNFNIYDPMKKGMGLTLDGQTLAHLEILQNNEGSDEGSLLKLLSRCITPFGKRLFRIWLCMPLRDIGDINARLDAVQDILDHPTFEATFTDVAKGIPDLERIVSRIHAKSCRVKDFLKVLKAFERLNKGITNLADEAASFKSTTILGLLRGAPDLTPHLRNVRSLFQPAKDDDDKIDELVPRDGKDERYDEVVAEINELEKSLNADLTKFEKSLGIKLAYWHSAVGNKDIYLIEVSTSVDKKKLPNDWTKSSGTKAKNRYVVGSLQKRVRQLKEAQENRTAAIKAFKFRLFTEFDVERALWLRAIRVFAELDCLFSLAKSSAALGEPACRPAFVDGDEAVLDFEELRHPTLCMSTTLKNFIPNDVKMGGDVGKIVLLTGPNMAILKVMRMTATGVIMAQLGMLVPATQARLSAVDMIITRMGAYDNMFSNASTFKVELDECCKILRNATPKSLVILDELGRGTSTFDGMAIASAVLHELATHTLPLSFFATHYGSLTDDHAYHPNIRRMYMSTLVDDEKHELVFLYKLIDGVAESSFGTHVANLAGVPRPVVDRADVISKDFAKQFKEKLQIKQEQHASAKIPLVAQADFAYLYKLGTGETQLPEDRIRRKEVLVRMKDIVRRYLAKS